MLRVVSPEEMRQIEQIATNAGTSVETLMELAGKETAAVVSSYVKEHALSLRAFIVTGTGNNGGDGYVVARYLMQDGFSVQVAQAGVLDSASLVKKQRRRYEARGGKVIDLDLNQKNLTLPHDGVIVDALFGTGFHGRQQPHTINIINAINTSKLPVFSVDVPSGLNAQTGIVEDVAVQAHITCCMQYPKLGFFLQSGWNHAGQVLSLPIGLEHAANQVPCTLYALEKSDAKRLLPQIVRTRHKYEAGHVVGLAGTHGMAGSALMASHAAMRSGAGIVHLLHPKEASSECMGEPREVVRIAYSQDNIEPITTWLAKATGAFIGPGLGTTAKQDTLLEAVWPYCKQKMVVDADALTWLAKSYGTNFGPLPNAILTPHLGELHRFFPEKEPITATLLKKCQKLVDDNQTHLILKGGPSFLFSHTSSPIVLMQGDPGMATAGSGDVLTGILASLLSQGLTPHDAMILGSYLHARAGEIAAHNETSYCMMASSIIANLPVAFKEILH